MQTIAYNLLWNISKDPEAFRNVELLNSFIRKQEARRILGQELEAPKDWMWISISKREVPPSQIDSLPPT